jgi:hypothetical protein
MSVDPKTYLLTEKHKFGQWALVTGIIALAISIFGTIIDHSQFFHSYLVAFLFWTSIALGGLFFTMLNHVTNARWSIVLRRLMETAMIVLPILALFFIPLLFGLHDLYHWTHKDAIAHDVILQKKSAFLNTPFFIIRAVFYFGIWIILGRILYKNSLLQDKSGQESYIKRMRNLSAPGLILFAVTITFAAFDWLISLNPHWYSTIFGLYFFSGCFLSILAFLIILGNFLGRKGILSEVITKEHYHDLAKLLFGFIIFWGYMGFSQYFLIWYANIPEETIWYLVRWEGNWKFITLTIVIGHFLIPFVGLLIRAAKRNRVWLIFISAWIMIMHWIDIYWMVFPTFSPEGFYLSWMDLALFIGIGGIFLWYFWYRFSSNALVPIKDMRLPLSLEFKNN